MNQSSKASRSINKPKFLSQIQFYYQYNGRKSFGEKNENVCEKRIFKDIFCGFQITLLACVAVACALPYGDSGDDQ